MRGTRAIVAVIAAGALAPGAGAAVSAGITISGGLAVSTSSGSAVALTCDAVTGDVKVNGSDPTGGPTLCSALTSIGLDGDSGQNVWTVSNVDQYGANVQIDGLGGDDQVFVGGTSGSDSVQLGPVSAFLGTRSVQAQNLGAAGTMEFDGFQGADSISISGGVWKADGGDGSDSYHAVFGALGTGASIDDHGPTGADSLDFTNCAASVSAPGVLSLGGQSIAFAGLESAPICSAPWPTCNGTTITRSCVSAFTVDGGAPPGGITLTVTETASGLLLQVRNGTDFELAPALGAASVVHVALNTGSIDPGIVNSTGAIASVATTYDAVGGNTLDLVLSPRPSSWFANTTPCTVLSCGGAAAADVDYADFLLASAGVPPLPGGLTPAQQTEFATFLTDMHGAWLGTNAQSFSSPTWDPTTETLGFRLAAPHLTHAGLQNDGFVTAFVPNAVLSGLWGLDPASVSASSFAVTKSDGSTDTVSPTVVSDPGGIEIRMPLGSFHYSTPAFTVGKAPPSPTPPPAPTPPSSSGSSSSSSSGTGSVPAPVTPQATPPAAPAVPAPPPVLAVTTTVPKTVGRAKPAIRLALTSSLDATVRAVLTRKGVVVAHWTRYVAPGSSSLTLSLPLKARKRGTYVLTVTTVDGAQQVVRRTTLRIG
jgi:hypothetical protein